MGERAASYRGAVGLSFYGYTACCGAKLTARSQAALRARGAEHRAHCPKAKRAAAGSAAVQDELGLEAPHAG